MAKNDFHVIVYQILSYLYDCLKRGDDPDPRLLKHDSPIIGVNERYWGYILVNMQEQGYIKGASLIKACGHNILIGELDEIQITPFGIEYLTDNSFMSKAKEFARGISEISPLFMK